MAKKNSETAIASAFGFKTTAGREVFKKIVLRVLDAIKDIERSLEPGDKLGLKSMELHLEVDGKRKPKKKKKK